MADKKISDLTSSSSVSASDLFEIENGSGNSRKVLASAIKAYAGFPNRAYTDTLVNSSTSSSIPFDSTKPQISEGTEILTLSITPSSTTARIRVEINVKCYVSTGCWVILPLFINGGTDAVDVTLGNVSAGGGAVFHGAYEYVPGSTSAQTISLRAGRDAAATVTFNAYAGSTFGGVVKTSMIAREVVG